VGDRRHEQPIHGHFLGFGNDRAMGGPGGKVAADAGQMVDKGKSTPKIQV